MKPRMDHPRPTSIRIFLADGKPDGLRIVEKSNWTGRAIVASRVEVGRALSRPEMRQPGLYVRVGSAINGRDVWEDGSGVPLKTIQEARTAGQASDSLYPNTESSLK